MFSSFMHIVTMAYCVPSILSEPCDCFAELGPDYCQCIGNVVAFLVENCSSEVILRSAVEKLEAFRIFQGCHQELCIVNFHIADSFFPDLEILQIN